MRIARLALLALPLFISIANSQAQAPNWSQIEEETMRHFQAILRLDTSNPPGNETLVVEYLKSVLDKEGIETKVFANDPGSSVLSRVEILGGKYGRSGGVHEKLITLPLVQGQKTVEGIVPGGYDFYYAMVFKEGVTTARAFSAPIWMDNQ